MPKSISSAYPAKSGRAEKVTVTGVLQYGTLDSSITDEKGGDVTFLSNDKKSKKIFDKCHGGDTCKVTAMVEKKEDTGVLKKVVSVELVKRAD
jgi:hypothetical protein